MPMVWIAVGDIHNDSTKLHTIPELETAEGIIITGDITLGEGKKKSPKNFGALYRHWQAPLNTPRQYGYPSS